jgi:hypothetical protein
MGLTDEENQGTKISRYCPFNPIKLFKPLMKAGE